MDEHGGHYAKWNKRDTEWKILHDNTYTEKSKIVELIEAEGGIVITRGWREGKQEILAKEYKVSVMQDEWKPRDIQHTAYSKQYCTVYLKFY